MPEEKKELEYPYNLVEFLWNELKDAKEVANMMAKFNEKLSNQVRDFQFNWLPREHFKMYAAMAKYYYDEAKKAGVEISIRNTLERELLGLKGED